jgi:ribulose 1,5-bisphosphate synthetase/thiazole synthase
VSIDLIRHMTDEIELMSNADILVIGSGLSGLACVYQIIKSTTKDCNPPLRVAVLEKGSQLGGSSPLMAPLTVIRKPAVALLNEMGLNGLYTDCEQYAMCENSTLKAAMISKITHVAASNKGVVLKFFPSTEVEDVLLQKANEYSPVSGVAAAPYVSGGSSTKGNSAFAEPQRNYDVPYFLNTKVLVSCGGLTNATDGVRRALTRLNNYGFTGTRMSDEPFLHRAVDINAEDAVVHYSREVSPGLICAGSEITWLDYLSHPPSHVGGGRLLSGLKAGKLAIASIQKQREAETGRGVGYEVGGHFLHDDILGVDVLP